MTLMTSLRRRLRPSLLAGAALAFLCGLVVLWSFSFGPPRDLARLLPGRIFASPADKAHFASAAFSPDGTLVAASDATGGVYVWKASSGRLTRSLQTPAAGWGPTKVRFARDGRSILLLAPGGERCTRADVLAGTQTQSFDPRQDGWVLAADFSPDGARLLTGGAEAEGREGRRPGTLWHSGPLVHQLREESAAKGGGTPIPTRGVVRLWDTATGQVVKTLFADSGRGVAGVAVAPDGTKAATVRGDWSSWETTLWDLTDGRALRTWQGKGGHCGLLAFAPDGRRLLTACDEGFRIRDLETGDELHALSFPADRLPYLSALAFAPDGRFLVSAGGAWGGSDGTPKDGIYGHLRLWDLDAGAEVPRFAAFDGRRETPNSVAVSPDGRYVLTAGPGVKLWDFATGKLVRTFAVGR